MRDGDQDSKQVADAVKERVRSRYRAAARQTARGMRGGDGAVFYDPGFLGELPQRAVALSLGCGNPNALVDLVPGEVVLDLGSGGGIDVLLSARRVGPAGKAYGLDMTDEMLALARENQRQAGLDNVEFIKGDIEDIPLPDASVDVVISNCVINLAADKDRVLSEAFRVLRPGGRFAVSDTVFQGDLTLIPDALRQDTDAWCACVSGALGDEEYLAKLRASGFTGVSLQVTHVYGGSEADEEDHAGATSGGASCCDSTAGEGASCCDSAAGEGASCCDSASGEGASCCDSGGISLPEGVRLTSAFVRGFKPAKGPFDLGPARPEDLPAVARLLRESDLTGDGLEAQFPDGFVVTRKGSPVVGAAGLEVYGRHGLLRSVVVSPCSRASGLGGLLIRDRQKEARRLGLETVWLLTTTAAGFFPGFGFSPALAADAPPAIRSSVEFSGACPKTALAMAWRV